MRSLLAIGCSRFAPLLVLAACTAGQRPVSDLEQRVHRSATVVDAHSDITESIVFADYDFAVRHRADQSHQDLPRMREGGVDAQIFAIWIEAEKVPKEQWWPEAERELVVAREKLAKVKGVVLARTASEIRAAKERGEVAALFGIEGGHMLGPGTEDEQLTRLRRLAGLGARYLTLTHTTSNDLGGSSGDDGRTKGLTGFGRRMLAEMEKLGVIADVSHVSDPMFWDVVRAANKPVLASHSSARQLANVHRNVTDAMAQAIAKTGGAVCVNFFPAFLDAAWFQGFRPIDDQLERELGPRAKLHMLITDYRPLIAPRLRSLPRVTVANVADHVLHLVNAAGIDHVCIGSDYDGIPAAPEGLDDVSGMPLLTAELLRRGMGEAEVAKVLGGNLLRVLAAAEQ